MLYANKTKSKLLSGQSVSGVMLGIDAPRLVEICGLAGFDYIVIDAEHGPIDVGQCENMVRAAEVVGITPIVRVPSHDAKTIMRFLDIGAQGVMAPQVNSAEDAERVVSAVKYAPRGARGLAPVRAAAFGQKASLKDYVTQMNDDLLIVAQIESAGALDSFDDILAVDGIDAFELGTADLSQSLGVPGETSHPKVQHAVDRITERVIQAGRVISDTVNDLEAIRIYRSKGYRMLNCNLINVLSRNLRALNEEMLGAS